MDLEIKNILLEAASQHFKVPYIDPLLLDEQYVHDWLQDVSCLLTTPNVDIFWATCHKLRQKMEFVEPIKRFSSKLMSAQSTDKNIHYAAQCVLRKVFEGILLLTNGFQAQKTTPKPDHQNTSTTDAAHYYYLGFILLQLSKKFGHSIFQHFHSSSPLTSVSCETSWWTSDINRGGLVFPSAVFYNFFKTVLSIEDEYFRKNNKNTSDLFKLILSNEMLKQKWDDMAWDGDNLSVRKSSFREAIRLHIGGRSRAFVKFVKDNHKNKNRIDRTKKPLRKQLSSLHSTFKSTDALEHI